MSEDDFWDKKNTVRTYSDRQCLACSTMYSPTSYWSERCPECKLLNKPKFKKIANDHFDGRNPLPLDKLRIKTIDGIKMPSVTTVLHPHGIDYPEVLLLQYSSRGTLVHKQIEMFFKTGKWHADLDELILKVKKMAGANQEEHKHLSECKRIMEGGSLNLRTEQCNFPGFKKRYGHRFTFDHFEVGVHNSEHKYCGTFDCRGTYKTFDAIIDWKSAANYAPEKLESYFQQLSAYAHADQIQSRIRRLVVVPLNPKSQTGYDKPLVTVKVKAHFKQFLKKREVFKKIYGI